MKSMVMEQQKIHLIKLEKGDKVLESMLAYVQSHQISAGFLTGIGALAVARIGYFDTEKKQYLENTFEEVELVSCVGNIAINKDSKEPIAHIHIAIADKEGKMFGGHLNPENIVSVTAEIYLVETRPGVFRTKDDKTGLYLLVPKN